MPTYTDDRIEDIAGGALSDPYVTREGDVAAPAFVSHRRVGAVVVKGTGPATATGVGVVLDTAESWTGKLVSVRNEGVEKAYFDAEGRIHSGAAWDDVQGPASTAAGLSAVTTEAWSATNPFIATFFSSTQDDVLCWTLQFPHRWNRGEIRFHLHIVPMVDPAEAQVIRFDGSFAWAHPGTAVPGTWTDITPVSHTVNPGDALKPTIVPLFTTTPENAWESDILMVRVRRPGSSDAADTYSASKSATGGLTPAANVAILSADAHFQSVKQGTDTEIPT